MCKFQKIKKDEYGVIYKCQHNTKSNELAFIMKEDYEKRLPKRHFVIGNGVCPYGKEQERICPCFEEK